MRRSLLVIMCLPFLTTSAWVQTEDLKQYLHEHYANRIFILRDFLSGDHLSYDSLGSPTKHAAAGDWTETGFVTIGNDPRIENNHLVLNAQRMVVIFSDKRFQLSAIQRPPKAKKKHGHGPGFVELEIELSGTPSSQSVDAVLSKLFLNSHDSFVDLVPGYWRFCVSSGLAGRDANCAFAPELLTMLGTKTEGSQLKEIPIASPAKGSILHVAHDGVSPPKVTHAPEPQFSEAALALKLFQGTVTLGLVVNKDGRPSDLRILQPLGAGLDMKAVQTVENWKFLPAKKNGQPVSVEIAVEIDFHRY